MVMRRQPRRGHPILSIDRRLSSIDGLWQSSTKALSKRLERLSRGNLITLKQKMRTWRGHWRLLNKRLLRWREYLNPNTPPPVPFPKHLILQSTSGEFKLRQVTSRVRPATYSRLQRLLKRWSTFSCRLPTWQSFGWLKKRPPSHTPLTKNILIQVG